MPKVKNIRVRKARSRDLGLFTKLWTAYLISVYEKGSGVPPSKDNLEFFRIMFNLYVSGEEKGVVLFVGEVGVMLLGTAGISPIKTDYDPVAQGWGMYVEPDYQGQGICTALYTEGFKKLKEMGFKTILGHCMLEDEKAWGSLEKVGYTKLQYAVKRDVTKE